MSQLVSVIIPTFKRSNFLADAIKSVNTQTFHNIEIIVVDDNTDIREIDKVKKVTKDWNNVKYFKNYRTKGACGARNTGILEAKGELIAFLDDDDIWLPDKLCLQVEYLNYYDDIALVSCQYMVKPLKGKAKKVNNSTKYLSRNDFFKGKCPATTSLMLTRKEVLISAGLFDENLPSFQDFDLWVRCLEYGKLIVVQEHLVEFVSHDNDRVSINLDKRLKGLNLLINKWEKEIKRNNSIKAFTSQYKSIAYLNNTKSITSTVYLKAIYFTVIYFLYNPTSKKSWRMIYYCFNKFINRKNK